MKRNKAWQITKILEGFFDRDFARECGCSEAYIQHIVAGIRSNVAILERIDARIKSAFKRASFPVPKIEKSPIPQKGEQL